MESTNQSIYIINQDWGGGYDSNDAGQGREVTQAEYDTWVNNNAVTAENPNGDNVSIVGGDDKISVTDGTTTVGYDNVIQPGDGAGATTYSVAATSTTVADSTTSGLSATTQQQLDLAIETEITNLVLSNPSLATEVGRSLAIDNATLAANLLETDGNGFTLSTEERNELRKVVASGLYVAELTRGTLDQAQGVINTVRNLSLSDSSPVTLKEAKEILINDFYDQLTPTEKSIINASGIGKTFNTLIGDINNSGGLGIVGISNLGLVPYTVANDTLGLDTTQRITNELIAQYISQNGSITEEQIQAIETLVQTQNAINSQALVAANTGVADTEININLLNNQKVSTDAVTDTTLPTTDQGNTEIQTVEVTANTSVSKAIRDSLGIPNQGPILEKLIDKAINLGLNQIPGYPQINSAIGTANKIVKIGDIATNVDLSPAETALALARLFVPQINLVVTGYNLVTGGGAGGGGGVEALEPIPVSITDPQAGGGGEDDPPPGSLDYGPEAATTNTDADPLAVATTATVAEADTASFQDANLTSIKSIGTFVAVYNVETGTYDVYDLDTNEVVASGFTQAQATEYADALNVGDDYAALLVQTRADAEARLNKTPADVTAEQDPSYYPHGTPYDDEGNLNPGWALDENNNPVWIGGDYVEPATARSASDSFSAATQIQNLKNNANAQATREMQRGQAAQGDWRVKLRLAEGADYLYRDPKINENGLLWPLYITNGVVFPYTPTINTVYAANYSSYDLTHSNYRGYFYQNSYVDEINITATFTAQDTSEANYLLAVIHFFRSATKMFYGQDANRGQPPPLVFLQGLGEFQFNLHPCVIRSFNYNLPGDVDYIRARVTNVNGTNLLSRRDRATTPSGTSWLSNIRLGAAGLNLGGLTATPAPPTLGTTNPTYVPTKLDATITLLPIQTRNQVSKQFSLKQYANGDLLKGGFW